MRNCLFRPGLCLCMLLACVAGTWAQYTDWSAPVNLGSVINSPFTEETPFLSRDGLHLYFTSDRPGGFGGSDLWVTSRTSVSAPWGTPVNLGPQINTADNESHPTLSIDGHVLYFDRLPVNGGTYDMYSSRRHSKFDDAGWTTAVNLGSCINTPANDSAMIFFEDDTSGIIYAYFNSNRSGNPEFYATILDENETCNPVTLITDLNTSFAERNATIRHDGLEILFESNRFAPLDFNIWSATRPTVLDHWSPSVPVESINSPLYDGRPALSWQGTELYFFSNRGGDFDLYRSIRSKIKSE